jgi:hypothetical protein
MIAQ